VIRIRDPSEILVEKYKHQVVQCNDQHEHPSYPVDDPVICGEKPDNSLVPLH